MTTKRALPAEGPFALSTHFRLFVVYPLGLVTPERPSDRELIERSLRHWISFEGALQGYSFTGAASIAAILGNGDEALGYLNQLIDRYVTRSTMYMEWDSPVLETPLSAAASIHDMILHTSGGVIRVFPAVPVTWSDVEFSDLRADGAFLISARRESGCVRWVKVESLCGESARLCIPWRYAPYTSDRPDGHGWQVAADGMIDLALDRNQSVTFTAMD